MSLIKECPRCKNIIFKPLFVTDDPDEKAKRVMCINKKCRFTIKIGKIDREEISIIQRIPNVKCPNCEFGVDIITMKTDMPSEYEFYSRHKIICPKCRLALSHIGDAATAIERLKKEGAEFILKERGKG